MKWSTTTVQTSATVFIALANGLCIGQLAEESTAAALAYAAITLPLLILTIRWDRKRLIKWLTWDGEL